MLDDAVL